MSRQLVLFGALRCSTCGRILHAEWTRYRGIARLTGRFFCWVCEGLG